MMAQAAFYKSMLQNNAFLINSFLQIPNLMITGFVPLRMKAKNCP